MDGNSAIQLSPVERDQLMGQVKQQLAIANYQELISEMTKKCFEKCITRPGKSVDNSEQKCVNMCMDRFIDSWNIVSKSYTSRIDQERNAK